MTRAITLVVLAALSTIPLSAEEAAENAVRALEARATVPAESAGARDDLRDVDPGLRLFWMLADDHVRIVRSMADVTGDGIAEGIVGWDDSQGEPLVCLDGSSSGSATVVWSRRFFDGASGGNPYSSESIVPIGDTDSNSFPNLLIGTAGGGRTAYNVDGEAGDILWKFDTYNEPDSGWVYSVAEIDDMNDDGINEVAFGVGSYNDHVYLVDGADASGGDAAVLWRYHAADAVVSVHAISDVNDDGFDDVVAGLTDNGEAVVCLDGKTPSATPTVLWTYPAGDGVWDMEILPDITGDGIDEVLAAVWALGGSAVRCINGASGLEQWRSTTVLEYGMQVELLGEMTRDGAFNVIVGSWENAVSVLDGADGTQVWKTTVGSLNGGDVTTVSAISDLNGDGVQDVIAGSYDEYVYALSGADGAVIWAYNTGHRVYSVAPIADVNGDGVDDVIA